MLPSLAFFACQEHKTWRNQRVTVLNAEKTSKVTLFKAEQTNQHAAFKRGSSLIWQPIISKL